MHNTQKTLRAHGLVPEELTANDGQKFIGWSKPKGMRCSLVEGGLLKRIDVLVAILVIALLILKAVLN